MRTKRTTPTFLPTLLSALTLISASIPVSATTEAQTSATFTINNLRYDLTDLDPHDGITPTLTFMIDPNVREPHAIVRPFGHFGEVAREFSPRQTARPVRPVSATPTEASAPR